MGPPVDAAVLCPGELQFRIGRTGNPAAVDLQRAQQRAFAIAAGRLIRAVGTIVFVHGCIHAAVDGVEAGPGEPQRQRGDQRGGGDRAGDHQLAFGTVVMDLVVSRRFALLQPGLPRGHASTNAEQDQQESQRHGVLTFFLNCLFCFQLHAAAFGTRLFRSFSQLCPRCRLLPFDAVAFRFVEICQTAAGQGVDPGIDIVCAQERQQFLRRNSEEEFGVRSARIGAEAVHAQHAPAPVEQRAAGIAPCDWRGMQDGIELAAWPRAGNEPAAFHRRLRIEDVVQIQPLRLINIHGVADRGYFAAVAVGIARNRQRRKAQGPGDFNQRQIIARADRQDFRIIRVVPF